MVGGSVGSCSEGQSLVSRLAVDGAASATTATDVALSWPRLLCMETEERSLVLVVVAGAYWRGVARCGDDRVGDEEAVLDAMADGCSSWSVLMATACTAGTRAHGLVGGPAGWGL